MNYLQNHCWCTDSIWGGAYDCRHIVSFNAYESENEYDWHNLVDLEAENMTKRIISDLYQNVNVPNLKPEVLEWLKGNVEDRKIDSYYKDPQGWAIGSTEYRERNSSSMSIFFHRKRDAMAFIKRWSKWKKPVFYCQYFTDVRKELDLVTGKYKVK